MYKIYPAKDLLLAHLVPAISTTKDISTAKDTLP
jgi:hypothetical protein